MNIRIVVLGALSVLAALLPDHGFTQAPFYQGKTITIIAGTAPGGIGDNRIKSVVPFLRKYIPGNPAVVVQYMVGHQTVGIDRHGQSFPIPA